jgi:hypothetical protein
MAGAADDDEAMRDLGTNLMIAGIVWQVATLLVFGILVVDYAFRTWRAWGSVSDSAKILFSQRKFKNFLISVWLAFLAIFARCVYRIAEMVKGWGNPIMRDEPSFIAMEGL